MTAPSAYPLDDAYLERVYAGVLGKIVGVYLGRPVEGWEHDRISRELGDLVGDDADATADGARGEDARGYLARGEDARGYLAEPLGIPLIVTDDDITGTFVFARALADHPSGLRVTPAEIGQSWLNYLIEDRTVLWWGGLGNSTEHTAYLRMKRGILPPRSGSAALGSRVHAEQIGAQIFVDGWAMACPGDPALAADLARRAGSVSHDGEALHAAAALAAMEAEAFVDPDTQHLLDTALSVIPHDSVIAHVYRDLRDWYAEDPHDWRAARDRIEERYGYDTYGGNVHVVPNHALILLGLLWGDGDLTRSLEIVTAAGWDTDCNAGNLGALVGLQLGLAGFDRAAAGDPGSADAAARPGVDWRGPIGDRLFLPTADGARAISDAVREAVLLADMARTVRGEEARPPKGGARFSFAFPGSTQSFAFPGSTQSFEVHDGEADAALGNAWSDAFGARVLTIAGSVTDGGDLLVGTPTFIPPAQKERFGSYDLLAVPTLYPGQHVTATLVRAAASEGVLAASLAIAIYDEKDELRWFSGPATPLGGGPGDAVELEAIVPPTGGSPIAAVGIRVIGEGRAALELDRLDWTGVPTASFVKAPGEMWKRAWIDALWKFDTYWAEDTFRIVQNEGTGVMTTGADWADVHVETEITVHMAQATGLLARSAGQNRYKALTISEDGLARLVLREHEWEEVFASLPIDWQLDRPYALALETEGDVVRGWVDGVLVGEVVIPAGPAAGGIGLLITEGRAATDEVRVRPL